MFWSRNTNWEPPNSRLIFLHFHEHCIGLNLRSRKEVFVTKFDALYTRLTSLLTRKLNIKHHFRLLKHDYFHRQFCTGRAEKALAPVLFRITHCKKRGPLVSSPSLLPPCFQVYTQRRGRLSIEIKQEKLCFLLEEGFKVSARAIALL